jgi:hypothetical protein
MKTLHRSMRSALVALAFLSGCVNQPDVDSKDADEHPAAASEPVVADAAVRVEQAERALEMGRDLGTARATLEAVMNDKSAPADVRDRAALSLSRALELMKDSEGAIRAVESLLAAHAGDSGWAGHEAAERRLRKLLTGKEERGPGLRRPQEKVAPFAKILSHYFLARKGEPADVSIVGFGGDGRTSERLGTFNVEAALREKAEEECPLCDTKINIRAMTSMSDSWTAIPAAKKRLDSSLVVFYTHLGDMIPARYQEHIPVPIAEITAHLQKGEGVVAARERPGAPPVILIAAPREAQLGEVEDTLSLMKTLPTSLTVVKISNALQPIEIQTVVRQNGMPEFKKCYEAVLTGSPGAAGKVVLAFGIKADGTMDDLKVEPVDGFGDPGFHQCMTDAAAKLHFPAGAPTNSVKYPIQFSP